VLRRGGRKIALVEADLFAIFGGLPAAVADRLSDLGFNRSNIVLAASHTHDGPISSSDSDRPASGVRDARS
jgi:hypothetical protein